MTTEELAPVVKGPRPVHPTRFRQAEGAFNVWSVIPEFGTTLDDVLNADYWSHNASKMRPNDRIYVDAEDGTWTALLFVRSVSRLSANVAVISKTEFEKLDKQSLTDDFLAKWKGPMHKWAVVRAADEKTILQGGFENQEDALKYIALNARSMAA